MEVPTAVVETSLVGHPGAKRDSFTVSIDGSHVINTIVGSDVTSLEEYMERTSIAVCEWEIEPPNKRVFGLSVKCIPLFDEDNEPGDVDGDVREVAAVFSLCYGNECLIYQLYPDPSARRGTPFPLLFRSIFSPEKHIFVGSRIREGINQLNTFFPQIDENRLTYLDITDCNGHPALNTGMVAPNLRSMGRRVLGKDIVPKPPSQRPWDATRLSKKQIEIVAVSSFISAKIGTTFGI